MVYSNNAHVVVAVAVGNRCSVKDGRVIDEDVERSEVFRCEDQCLPVAFLRNVGMNVAGTVAQFCRELLSGVVEQVGDDNLGAFLNKTAGGDCTHTARGTSNNRDLA